MALLLRRSLISSFGSKPLPVSGVILFFSTSSNSPKLKTLTSVSYYLINQHDFSRESALKISSLCNRPEKVSSLITVFKDSGFSQSQLVKTISRGPFLLKSRVETIRTKLNVLRDLGFEPSAIAEMLSSDPGILKPRTELLVKSVSSLTKILGSGNVSDLKLSSWFVNASLDDTLLPNIEFLKQCGVDSEQIAKYVSKFARFLLHKPEKIRECVEIVDQMGVPRQSKRYLIAVCTVGSMSIENWGKKWHLFKSLGFSEQELLNMFRKMPHVFAVSDKKIRDVWNVMAGFDRVSLIMSRPITFMFSVEKRLEPRLKVYRVLESRNLLKNKMNISELLNISDEKFFEFVSQFADELGDEFSALKSFKGLNIAR